MRIILCLRRTLDQDNRTEEGSESRCSPSKNCVQEMFLVVSSRQQLSLYVWPLDLVLGQGQGLHGIPRIGFPQNPILHRSQKLDIFCCHFHSRDTSKARLLFLLIHTHVLISFNQLCWLFQSYFKCKLFLLYKTCRLFNYSTFAPIVPILFLLVIPILFQMKFFSILIYLSGVLILIYLLVVLI